MYRTAALALAATLLVATVPAAAAAAPAARAADTAVPLPIASAWDVAAAGGNVFVSGGPGSTSIAVTAADGTNARTIDGLAGPSGLLVSPDGATVYAALADGDGVAVVNARTARVRTTYATGAAGCSFAIQSIFTGSKQRLIRVCLHSPLPSFVLSQPNSIIFRKP
jgi:hypothetical protein